MPQAWPGSWCQASSMSVPWTVRGIPSCLSWIQHSDVGEVVESEIAQNLQEHNFSPICICREKMWFSVILGSECKSLQESHENSAWFSFFLSFSFLFLLKLLLSGLWQVVFGWDMSTIQNIYLFSLLEINLGSFTKMTPILNLMILKYKNWVFLIETPL